MKSCFHVWKQVTSWAPLETSIHSNDNSEMRKKNFWIKLLWIGFGLINDFLGE